MLSYDWCKIAPKNGEKNFLDAWDDIQYLLALVRHGSVRGAAHALKVNHTTVSRRVHALESRLDSRLIQRTPDGYSLTSDGKIIYDSGKIIEHEFGLALKRVQGSNNLISGKIRITLTDLLFDLISPTLQELLTIHTNLKLEIAISAHLSDIARRNADIALRLSAHPPEDLVGRKLGRLPIAIYASKKLVSDPDSVDLNKLPWVRWSDPWKKGNHESWPQEHYPKARIAARVDSYLALEKMVILGTGVALLSPLSANRRGDLVQLSEVIEELGIDLWILMHPDLRGVRRIKVVMDAVTQAIRLT